MELLSFDEILIKLCDDFDALIAPKKIARSNTNIIYLIFKAIAKGMEVINNVCVVLSNKFDPARCSVEDLNSVAQLVGTERLKGSASGLRIVAENEDVEAVTLPQGVYTYSLDEDTKFIFEVFANTPIEVGESVAYIAMSEKIGNYPVTAQSSIAVEATVTIPDGIHFSCTNNVNLLGTKAESDLEFRKRILQRYDGQDSITELETQLRNLPYIFDCRIKYNNTVIDEVYDGITLHPFTALITYSGSPRSEMAEIIANKIICPTVQLQDSIAMDYISDVFIGGKHTFYITPFGEFDFKTKIIYRINEQYNSAYDVEEAIKTALNDYFNPEVYRGYITEDDVYNIIEGLNLKGVTLLAVNLKVDNSNVDYIEVPSTKIAHLAEISFTKEVI